jgi:3-(3-hydroxy-phenyl)propionate hydroxylase
MQSASLPFQVLVVGLGPVGATISNLLGRYGIRTLVIEQAHEIFAAPRAISLDNEALRILQMCGLEEGDFDTVAIPHVRMHSPFFGLFATANSFGPQDGHPKLVTFFQPELETVLRSRLKDFPNVKVQLGASLTALKQGDDGVHAELSIEGVASKVRVDYVIGADGANSTVRNLVGLGFKGRTFPEDWLVVDAKRLPLPIDHVEFLCSHERPTPHMVAPGGRQRWEFKLRPGETREQMERPETIRQLLAPWASPDAIEIERVAVYRFHARVADSFSAGRVFLAGDAAHITPPFVGQGLVAGLRDAGNLCWKLAWVLKGQAAPAILSTYDRERRPHVVAMVRLATRMGKLVMPRTALAAWLSHGVMVAFRLIPRLRRLFEELEMKPPHSFKTGLVAKNGASRVPRGSLLAQGWVRKGLKDAPVLSDTVLNDKLTVIGFGVDPARHIETDVAQRWLAAGGRFVQIDPRGRPCTPSSSERWEDVSGDMVPRCAPLDWVVIVRPDRAVLHDGPVQDLNRLINESLEVLGRDPSRISLQMLQSRSTQA